MRHQVLAFWIKTATARRSSPTEKTFLSLIKMNSLVVFLFSFSVVQAFSFGIERKHQPNELCNQRCQRASNPWTVKSLRKHLSKKLRVHLSEITVPGAAGIIDIGSCSGKCRNGGQCHPNERTRIVFEINDREFVHEDYYIIDSCSCSSELHKTINCPGNFWFFFLYLPNDPWYSSRKNIKKY